ncbi:MAG: glycosyltransferase [Desulfobulbaceae bacterium]|nr:glycosyltransferase [Desulfobulbaceae bacterium]
MTKTLSPRPLVSIVLPTFNEKGNIERLIPALRSQLPGPVEFLVIDDNSPDGTAAAVAALQVDQPDIDIRLIVRKHQRGLVSAIQRGIDESRGEIIVWMDCDFSLPPNTVPELIRQVEEQGRDAAIGSRYVPGGGDQTDDLPKALIFVQKIATALLNRFTCLLLQTDFHDWTSGFIAIRAEVVKKFPLQGDYGEYFIILMANLIRHGHTWQEVPYYNIPRIIGESKTADSFWGLLRRGVRYIFSVFRARIMLSR